MKTEKEQACEPSPFNRMRDLTKKLVQVPRKEVMRKAAAYERKKAKRRGK